MPKKRKEQGVPTGMVLEPLIMKGHSHFLATAPTKGRCNTAIPRPNYNFNNKGQDQISTGLQFRFELQKELRCGQGRDENDIRASTSMT